jgi:hypothetical protein
MVEDDPDKLMMQIDLSGVHFDPSPFQLVVGALALA